MKELGWYPLTLTEEGEADPLVGHFRSPEPMFQWHGYTFDLPKSASHLAATPACPHQAFRYGHNVYGFQFHMEVDGNLIEAWLERPSHQEEIRSMAPHTDIQTIQDATTLHLPGLLNTSLQTYKSFVELFPNLSRFQRLDSR